MLFLGYSDGRRVIVMNRDKIRTDTSIVLPESKFFFSILSGFSSQNNTFEYYLFIDIYYIILIIQYNYKIYLFLFIF